MAHEAKHESIVNVLAIAGFVVVIIIIIWGLVHFSSLISPWLSSLFASKPATTSLQVGAPEEAVSGEAFTLTWSAPTSGEGNYSLIYPCNDSLRFETAGPDNTSNTVPCGAAFGVSGNSLTLVPLLSSATATPAQLSVVFLPSSGSGTQAQGSATILIQPGKAPAPVAPARPALPQVAGVGPSDLSVTLASANADQYGNATVVFAVANTGANSSGPYTFQVYLPTRATYTYTSPVQASLPPSSHIINTLRFTQAVPGTVSVVVDSSNSTQDQNRTNNYAGATLSIPYGYNSQPYYGQQAFPYVY